MRRIVLSIMTFLAFSVTAAEHRIVAVHGSGVIEAIPDIIQISFSVSKTSGKDASEAKSIVDEISARCIESLIEIGVDKGEFSSSSLTVYPHEEYSDNGNITLKGHMVSRSVEVVLKDIKLYNSAIQALIDSGVTEISSVSPDVSNYDELKQQAIAVAAEDARSSAAFLAKELGAELGEVRQIGKQQLRRQFSLEEIVVTSRRMDRGESVVYEFEPGTVEVSASLYVEFELK